MENLAIGFITLMSLFVAFTKACDVTFTDRSGTFTSPSYPSNYPDSTRCVYEFETGFPIAITCDEFLLQSTNREGNCVDYFRLQDSTSQTDYCGSTGPEDVETDTENVKVIFRSNKRKNFSGFSCTYESLDGTTTTVPVPDLLQNAIDAHDSSTCSRTTQTTCGCTDPASEYYTTIRGSHKIVTATGIPDHVYEVGQTRPNPNQACEHRAYMAVPANPTKGSIYNTYGMGPVGIAISGGFFYNHLSDPQGAVAVLNEQISFDVCNGHSDGKCRYHYHKLPICIHDDDENCNLVGYMRDGFPVHTYCKHPTKNRLFKSCYVLTTGDGTDKSHYTFDSTGYANGDCDLDEANGYTFNNATGYVYVFTEEYPFIMAGYYGTELADMCYMYD